MEWIIIAETLSDFIDYGRYSIETKPLTRCHDCKHHSYDAGYGYDWCNRLGGVFRVKPDSFCSFAERRTDGN